MIGKTLGGRYEIYEKIDSGGMAYIYKANCKKTNKAVAIKILKDEFAGSSEYVNRFKREAQAAFKLDHDNIVSVYDVGFDENVYYMVMEFIDGPTLKSIIETSGFLPEKQAIEYTIQICSAIMTAHKHGIIHRDIKPQNILVDENDTIKVTDFGIAKSIASEIEKSDKVIGSVYYVSPEQAKGEKVDQRSDIYSLGIVLYEMMTGELPYKGEKSIAVALKHINEQIVPPIEKNEEISKSLNNIIIKATSKDKRDRYSDVNEFKKDLTLSLIDKDGEFVDVPSVRERLMGQINLRKNNIWKIAVITVTLLILTVGGVFGGNALFGNVQELPDEVKYNAPDLIGINLMEAKNILDSDGLKAVVLYQNTDEYQAETVIGQSPEPGSIMLSEDDITLTVSSGPVVLYMPNLIGTTKSEATQIIEDMGLTIDEVSEVVDETLPTGTVVSQVPDADSDILEDTAVSIVVSTQPDQDTGVVPYVVDTTLEQAVDRLRESGFLNTFVYDEESSKEQGTVIRQSPEQGKSQQFDIDIDLTISEYTDMKYEGSFDELINVSELGSKVKLAYIQDVGDSQAYFVVHETQVEEAGDLELNLKFGAVTGGIKKVVLFINYEPVYEYEVYFYERSVEE